MHRKFLPNASVGVRRCRIIADYALAYAGFPLRFLTSLSYSLMMSSCWLVIYADLPASTYHPKPTAKRRQNTKLKQLLCQSLDCFLN